MQPPAGGGVNWFVDFVAGSKLAFGRQRASRWILMDEAARTRTQTGSGRIRSNKRHPDSTTEFDQAVKRVKTLEDGINQDEKIEQLGELSKEWEDGAIQKEET
jgi:hypothetical protein